MLSVENIAVSYGPVEAVFDVSLQVGAGEIVSLIGSNGAGKSTTLKAIMGLLDLHKGRIDYSGETISGLAPAQIVGKGIALVPEARQLFPEMTVEENLEVGFAPFIGRSIDRARFDARFAEIAEIFPRVAERRRQLARTLSGGEQQMVAIGRALMRSPKVILLDEPSLGLSPRLVDVVMDCVVSLRRTGIDFLLVEQNAQVALEISDRAYVVERGKIVLAGQSADLLRDDRVKNAYLGLA